MSRETCRFCGKKYDNPLVLFDGARACPKCRRQITLRDDEVDFKFNDQNIEQFEKAEILYLESIKSISNHKSDELPRDTKFKIKAAIKFATEAFELGHPEAAILLSDMYFYQIDSFVGDKDMDLAERYRLAAWLLVSVLKDNEFQNEEGNNQGDAFADSKIKERAARKLKTILNEIAINQIPVSPADFESFRKTLEAYFPSMAEGIEAVNVSKGGYSLIQDLLRMDDGKRIVGSLNGTRPVNLAFINCSVADIETAMEDSTNYMSLYRQLSKSGDVYIYLFRREAGEYQWYSLRNKPEFKDEIGLKRAEKVFLGVFASGGRRKHDKDVLPDGDSLTRSYSNIISHARDNDTSLIFTDDDFAFFTDKKHKKPHEIILNLERYLENR
ncbi:MAG: hypothetical protein MJ239_05270 [Bacilli bacterium]|nr:hypothetical protein [Bacilli bacterium]